MQWKGPLEIKGNNYQVKVKKKVKTYHINMLKLHVKKGRIDETATPGRRDILGEPRGETQVGCGCVQGAVVRRLQLARRDKFGGSGEGCC